MANLSVLAQGNTDATPNEGNGVAGPTGPVPRTTNAAVAAASALPLATVTGTLAADNKYATNGTATLKGSAIRHSVAKTKSGATAASEVFSETMNFRTAYSGVESDSPAIKEASGDDDRSAAS
ncbi:MAG: hypothetical protein CL739_08115 [Chloroflexi bacterium]|nr:hypothetical protein [Chloroflexota bacterium]|tara:strand:+ start:139 stop:507 length:369 start_codon:yes stop_codon:yes gene_type:complete